MIIFPAGYGSESIWGCKSTFNIELINILCIYLYLLSLQEHALCASQFNMNAYYIAISKKNHEKAKFVLKLSLFTCRNLREFWERGVPPTLQGGNKSVHRLRLPDCLIRQHIHVYYFCNLCSLCLLFLVFN